MAINIDRLTITIIEKVGGANNIVSVSHCVTRLRFNLLDKNKVDTEGLKAVEGVLGIAYGMEQYQVILGKNVFSVFDNIEKNYHLKTGEVVEEYHSEDKKKITFKGCMQNLFGYIVSAVTPFITVIYGAGMLRVVMSLVLSIWPEAAKNATYMMFNYLALAPFYFMPILIAYGAAKKLKSNPAFAITIVAMLLYPDFVALVGGTTTMTIFGLPVTLVKYSNTLLPALLSTWLVAKLEKFFYKVIPGVLRSVFAPMLTLAVAMPIVAVFLAPIGAIVGNYVVYAFNWIYSVAGGFAVGILAASIPFIIMSGMNMMFAPFMVSSIASLGYDAFFRPAFLLHNMAEGGACLGVALRTKNKSIKADAISCAIGCIVSGVTEPAIYGITLKLKKPLIAVMIGAGVGGWVAGLFGAKAFAMGYSSILAIPIFESTMLAIVIAVVVTIAVSAVMTMILGFEDVPVTNKSNAES
jgi:PTS system beta-glucosides-specific IIC component